MNQSKLDELWILRKELGSGVSGFHDGKGQDTDWMTIVFDGLPARTFERQAGLKDWTEVPFLAKEGLLEKSRQ